MAKPEWGLKRACQSCGARFYDLKRDPIICPKCETVFDPLANLRPRRTRVVAEAAPKPEAKPKPKPKPKPEPVVEDDADAALAKVEDLDDAAAAPDDDADDESPIEDASELGEDEDDISEVPVSGDDEN